MKKVLTALAIVATMLMSMTGIAAAQTPMMEVSPASIDEGGETEIEVSLSGFSADLAVFILPCDYPAGGDLTALDTSTCDQANLTPLQLDGDGAGTVTVTYDVPAEGITVIAGDAAQTESAFALVSVGAAELAVTGPGQTLVFTMMGVALLMIGAGAVFLGRRTELA